MRKSGFILPLALIIVLFISIIGVTLLTSSSARSKIAHKSISKSELQISAGNIFFTNYSFLQNKYHQNSSLNLNNYSEYSLNTTEPQLYTEFRNSFNPSTLEGQGWLTLLDKFSSTNFFSPSSDLQTVFNKISDDKTVDMILIPHKSYPNTLLAVVKVAHSEFSAYFWGIIATRYFSNWGRFELEGCGNSMWYPGSVVYGPAFMGSIGGSTATEGGLRARFTVPPDTSDISSYGPIFNGEIWYETWNFDISLNDNNGTIYIYDPEKSKYKLWHKTDYAIYDAGSEYWIYTSFKNFSYIIVASEYEVKNGNDLYVKGKVEDFAPEDISRNFNQKFLPWFFPAGSLRVDQQTISDLETRFSEMDTYYSSTFGNMTSLEDILTSSYEATTLLQPSYTSNGISFEDTSRSLGEDSSIQETEVVEDITGTLDFSGDLSDIVNQVKNWFNSKDDYILSAKDKLGLSLNTDPLTTNQVEGWLENNINISVSGEVEVIISQEKTIMQTQQTGSETIEDKASNVDISADVLTGNEVESLIKSVLGLNPVDEFSVMKFSWPRVIKTGGDGKIRKRNRTATREASKYNETSETITITLSYYNWKYKTFLWWSWWEKDGGPFNISQNHFLSIPSEVSEWTDWIYNDWSNWKVIQPGGGGGKTYNADVDYYLITDSNQFTNETYNSIATYKVTSSNETAYTSFIATPVYFNNRGLLVVDESYNIGGAGLENGLSETLARDATIIDGRYTLLAKKGDIYTNGDIIYRDLLKDATFTGYLDQIGKPFDVGYDPNEAANNVGLNDMINIVASDGNIIMPYAGNYYDRNKIKDVKFTANLFAFGDANGNEGEINIGGYDKYNENMGYRNIFGTMVSRNNSAAGRSEGYGFKSRNYYDERLYSNVDMPYATPESNLLQVFGIDVK